MSPTTRKYADFIKRWALIFGMIAGISAYLVYHNIPCLHCAGPMLEAICHGVQPVLLFLMLFLSFCKIEPHQMLPHRWQFWLLLVQLIGFSLFALIELLALRSLSLSQNTPFAEWIVSHRVILESAMICLICPTATACAVVTGRLGGSMAGVMTYTIIINMLVALIIPLFVPLIYPVGDLSFTMAFSKILAKVFPLLIMPCLLAWMLRYLFPSLHKRILSYTNLSFHIWILSLSLAMAVVTRTIVKYEDSLSILLEIALVSLVLCAFQFYIGRRLGSIRGCKISAAQALAQKNTVFGIWMGYTFFDPLCSVACGFYIIWQNSYNAWQLNHRDTSGPKEDK